MDDQVDIWHQPSKQKDEEGKETAKEGRCKRGAEQSHADHEHNLKPVEYDGEINVEVDELFLEQDEPGKDSRECQNLDQGREHHPHVFAQDEVIPVDGLGDDGVNGSLVDLFVNKADASKNSDQNTKQRDRGEAHICGDLRRVPKGHFTQGECGKHHQQSKKQNRIQDFVSNGFTECIGCYGYYLVHGSSPFCLD